MRSRVSSRLSSSLMEGSSAGLARSSHVLTAEGVKSRLRETSATDCPSRTSATTLALNSSSYLRRGRWGFFRLAIEHLSEQYRSS